MDTSEIYIKMCEKAIEIQRIWLPQKGDLAYIPDFIFYRRKCKSDHTSVYSKHNYKDENPSWVAANKGIRGVTFINHSIDKEHHIKTDSTYPQSRMLVEFGLNHGRVEDEEWKEIEKCTWLPRQDDLQGMVKGTSDLDHLLERFDAFIRRHWEYKDSVTPIGVFGSMEQLWLAFVMMEKHNKVWNGEDWECK